MCGISGYYAFGRDAQGENVIARMSRAIGHRGPDDEGIALINPLNGEVKNLSTKSTARGVRGTVSSVGGGVFSHRIALAHRRYSIIDLSPNAHQPFWSSDGKICVCFNGEIYNYVELRDELVELGHTFRTTSDTEVLAEAFLEWGVEAFSRFVGFWALSLYDAREKRLLLSRDRMGKASLFVVRVDGSLWWSSEIKGLVAGAGSEVLQVREQAVADFLIRSWRDVNEQTFYTGVETFPKASYAWVRDDGSYQSVRYWSLPNHRLSESEIAPEEAGKMLRDHIAEALRVRLRADVPVGFELSGGMDSSSLMSVAATRGHHISAFSIGFPGTDADEEAYAKMVFERYRDKAEYNVVPYELEDFFDSADQTVGHMDEPFHSPNVMSIQKIWQEMRRRGFRVTISGSAGDELFAGYPGVYHSLYLWELLATGEFRRFQRECTLYSERPGGTFSSAYLKRVISAFAEGGRIVGGAPRQKLAHSFKMYKVSRMGFRGTVGPQNPAPSRIHATLQEMIGEWQMNYWLRISNISCMGVPIEIRSPLLDHRVVEYVFSLPVGYLIRDGWLKWILRDAMRQLLPNEILWRTNKKGFPFPYRHWLKTSKERFFSTVAATDIPYVDVARLRENYDFLVDSDPVLLWRFISVSLWWKKCMLGDSLN